MTAITIPSGDTQVWCCAASENERFHILLLQFLQYLSTLAIIAANSFEIIETLKVNQSVSCMAQLSSSVVCLAGFGVVIEMDVNTRKVWDSQISCNIYTQVITQIELPKRQVIGALLVFDYFIFAACDKMV